MAREFKNIKIPLELLEKWDPQGHILDWEHRITGKKLFKFLWHPQTEEFLMVYYPLNHKYAVLNYGNHDFSEYVRGIFFEGRDIVYLRMHQNEEWLRKTEKMLRGNGLPQKIRIIWGMEAYQELKQDLRGL